MAEAKAKKSGGMMRGLENRTPLEQAIINVERALELSNQLGLDKMNMTFIVMQAELRNAIMYAKHAQSA